MRGLARACTIAAWTVGVLGAAAPVVCTAQPAATSQATAPADALFADASAKEAAVRKALSADSAQPTVLKAVRTVVSDYENVVRHYPTSGYCDDALWRAATLARDAFEQFGETRERNAALRLLKLLASQYPSSRLAKAAPEQIAWLDAHLPKVTSSAASTAGAASTPAAPVSSPPAPAMPMPTSRPQSATAATTTTASTTTTTSTRLVNIKGIRRAVMKDLVRVVIELDDEVAFHDERIDGPARVFVDLSSTRANPALIDQTLRFDADTDIVRQIRIGRHANAVTRVVLEASGISSYSVYPLYSPFRLVIDCLRSNNASVADAAPVPTPGPTPQKPEPARHTPAPERAVADARSTVSGAPSATAPAAAPVPAAVTPTPLPVPAPRPTIARVEPASPTSPPSVAPPASRAGRTGVSGAASTITAASPASPAAPVVELPAWAVTLKKEPQPLAARRVRWVVPLPAGAVPVLPDVARSSADAVASTGVPKNAAPELASAPKPPASNLAGGLSIARQLGLGVSRIVIDPGHGGHDPGAKGPGVTEAELVLDVALRLEKLLTKLPGVEVVLTRRENEFIPLQERTAIANRENADLFLSIHANASSVPAARGIETYFLNFAQNQGAAAVAARENATSGQAMGSLQDVIKSIALNTKVDESRDFATYVQREMLASLKNANSGLKDLGVKQAPFVVLIGAAMPSILAEISFITNPQEAKLLKSAGYRQKVAEALFEGVRKYQSSLKTGSAVTAQQQN